MTSSSAYIPRGSIPYTQHWSSKEPGFSRISDDACPQRIDNYSAHFKALSSLSDTLFNNATKNLSFTQFTNPVSVSLTGSINILAADLVNAIVSYTPSAGGFTVTAQASEAASLIAEINKTATAGIVSGYSYFFTVLNLSGAQTFTFSYPNSAAGTTSDVIPVSGSATYNLVVNQLTVPAYYLIRITAL